VSTPPVVILVRHGESEHHIQRLTGGWTNTPLTELGHEQARRVAARLLAELGNVPVVVRTSDLMRSRQTAQHIAAAFRVEASDDARLREHNNGAAVDLTLTEAKERFPGVFDRPWDLDFRPFEGAETGREFYERVAGFIGALPAAGPLPVVVSHGGTILRIVAYWLGLPPEAVDHVGFAAHTTAITVLQRGRYGEFVVERLNDVAHLSGVGGWAPLPTTA
jgi:broad specificity phosphatase PhoE